MLEPSRISVWTLKADHPYPLMSTKEPVISFRYFISLFQKYGVSTEGKWYKAKQSYS